MNEIIVDNKGVRLCVEVAGEGPSVVLLHGFPDSARMWRHQVSALNAEGFSTIVPDMRGYGRSDKPEPISAYSVANLVGDVVAIIDALGIPRAHVVGHDWGANVAWALASFVPERVASLTAISVGHPTAFASAGTAQQIKIWYTLLFHFEGIAETWLQKDDWANFRDWLAHPDADAVIADLVRDGSLTPGINWYRANLAPEQWNAPPPEIPQIQAPTMGIWSSEDLALGEAQMINSARYVDASFRYVRLDGVGHWAPFEAPDAVARLLCDFLGSQRQSS